MSSTKVDAPCCSPAQDQSVSDNQPSANDKAPRDKVQLERRLGLWNGVAIITGVIVGSGIFISPTGVFREAGSFGATLIVWGLCGLVSLLGALCMAELGTSIADSGGDYSYIKMAYGPLLSFLYLWVTVLIILPCSNALAALTFANYILKPFYNCSEPPSEPVRLCALAIILLLVYINCRSVKWSIRLQNSFTLAKALALVIIIFIGMFYIYPDKEEKFTTKGIWGTQALSFTGLASAFYSGLYSYAGWNALNFITEEIKDPVKNMPRAIIISISSITLIYILVNVSYYAVLSLTEIESSEAIAVTFGERTLGPASFLIPLSVALSTTSGLNALIFSSSRILFVGARQGQLLSLLNMINLNNLSPVPSLLFVGLMSTLYCLNTHIHSLINYLTFIEAGFATIAVSTLLVIRRKYPNLTRPLRIPTWIPIVYLIISTALIIAPLKNNPSEALIGLAILLAGVPTYYLTIHWASKSSSYRKTIDRVNSLVQKLTMSVTPDDKET